jgi:hypothetical protein
MATTSIKDGYNGGSDNGAYVDSTGHLLVTGTFSASNPSIGVTGTTAPTSATEVGGINPSGNLQGLKVDAAGALLVDIGGVSSSEVAVPIFNDITSVAIGVETILNTFTAPAGPTVTYLLDVFNSGGNRAIFNVYNNGVLFDRQYTNVTQQNAFLDYRTETNNAPGWVIPPGNIIQVKVVNSGTTIADYNSRIYVLEVT